MNARGMGNSLSLLSGPVSLYLSCAGPKGIDVEEAQRHTVTLLRHRKDSYSGHASE